MTLTAGMELDEGEGEWCRLGGMGASGVTTGVDMVIEDEATGTSDVVDSMLVRDLIL